MRGGRCRLGGAAPAALLAVGLLLGCRDGLEKKPDSVDSRYRERDELAPSPSDASLRQGDVPPPPGEVLPPPRGMSSPRGDMPFPRDDASVASGQPIDLADLCVTLGALQRAMEGGPWINRDPKFRATYPASGGNQASVSFRYLGRTAQEERLGSGMQRWQLGLKLRAADTCNVVYVMWRFGTPSSVVASVKDNPGQRLHAECENRGYRNLTPLWSEPVQEPEPSSVHELSARILGGVVEVSIDARPVLRAPLEGGHVPEGGPSGLRSDNVSFELIGFHADALAASTGSPRTRCERMFGEEP